MNILFVISEVEDLAKTGGLADVGKALPLALKAMGHDVRIVKPYYRDMAHKYQLVNETEEQCLNAGGRQYRFHIKRLELERVPVYCVDYPDYFHRAGLYSDGYQPFDDNGERFAFFSMAALETAKAIDFHPDIIQCNDWHTALCPYFAERDNSGFFKDTRTLLTIHNGAFQGAYPLREIPCLQHDPKLISQTNEYGEINFLRLGVQYASKINAVSPNYASELLTPLGSHHLYQSFFQRRQDVSGILNGCDYSQWDPATDPLLPAHFGPEEISGKTDCKRALQQQFGLEPAPDIPLIGMLCRLTEQKGFGFLLPILEQVLQHRVQLIIVGTGDPGISDELTRVQHRNPAQFVYCNDFSNTLAHNVEAASDFFLMPSLFEPCGLNQMYSLAYGTLPIVRAVGGLADTVIDVSAAPESATGFVFQSPDSSALLHCIRRALLFYYEYPDRFRQVQKRAMQTRFTWQEAAEHYVALYQQALEAPKHCPDRKY
ncbi:Starch synthase [Saliniradius amylolyticus]|uniref:Glycogen synthase n=1 Tax=Saliniradius amylolyticus TaxID=2183582 RepID=A0A2S2DZN1_9ALTE|nr:glycogen synthase GlgA [Saliniradius amylolyticus]AWL10809.1 Starch synthase [Saliniradius amylolyticus]